MKKWSPLFFGKSTDPILAGRAFCNSLVAIMGCRLGCEINANTLGAQRLCTLGTHVSCITSQGQARRDCLTRHWASVFFGKGEMRIRDTAYVFARFHYTSFGI